MAVAPVSASWDNGGSSAPKPSGAAQGRVRCLSLKLRTAPWGGSRGQRGLAAGDSSQPAGTAALRGQTLALRLLQQDGLGASPPGARGGSAACCSGALAPGATPSALVWPLPLWGLGSWSGSWATLIRLCGGLDVHSGDVRPRALVAGGQSPRCLHGQACGGMPPPFRGQAGLGPLQPGPACGRPQALVHALQETWLVSEPGISSPIAPWSPFLYPLPRPQPAPPSGDLP